MSIEFRTHESIREVDEAVWDGLLSPGDPPFLRWAFLDALECSGCISPEHGWLPAHITLSEDGVIIGASPAYIKGNSEGEFVFDHNWARFAHQSLGVDYYPKLIVAVPFTPAVGPRLLCREGSRREQLLAALAAGLQRFTQHVKLSGAHVLFSEPEQSAALTGAGLVQRLGIQYHWRNRDYADFEAFLARFNSKRRNQIRRERRGFVDQGLSMELLSGDALNSTAMDEAFSFYVATVGKYYYGRQYLNREFFEELSARMPEAVQLVLARDPSSGKAVAGAINWLGTRSLYGRYWGSCEDRPFLHFNVCYYAGIEYCIEHKLQLFEPGAGGEHKLARGFEPTLTYSNHWLKEPPLRAAIEDFLGRESDAIRAHLEQESKKPMLKP